MMEDTYGCNLINTKRDGRQVTEFVGRYHVHILVRQGQMSFSDGKNLFTSLQDDLAIWQMSNTIQNVACSEDFEADVLLLSGEFLQQFNPEMAWASTRPSSSAFHSNRWRLIFQMLLSSALTETTHSRLYKESRV